MTPIYLGDWSDQDGLKDDFWPNYTYGDDPPYKGELEGVTILLAYYLYEDYSGEAYVLFERDGDLFEVHGSHCSCYGLEGQWEPFRVEKQEILFRLDNGTFGREYAWGGGEGANKFADELRALLT